MRGIKPNPVMAAALRRELQGVLRQLVSCWARGTGAHDCISTMLRNKAAVAQLEMVCSMCRNLCWGVVPCWPAMSDMGRLLVEHTFSCIGYMLLLLLFAAAADLLL